MATASEIITLAYREANFKNSIGAPTTEEFTEGLTLLQSIVDSLFGLVVGTKLKPWYIPRPQRTSSIAANFPASPGDAFSNGRYDVNNPPSNSRLMMKNVDSDVTVFFQYQPEDGAVMEYIDVGHEMDVTFDANGALFDIAGSNEVVLIPATYPTGRNTPRRWVYRGDYGSWLEITNLKLTSTLPFPEAFMDYFVTALAIRLSPRFGSEPRQVTLLRFQQMDTFIKHQYRQSAEALVGNAGLPTEHTYNTRGHGYEDFDGGGL